MEVSKKLNKKLTVKELGQILYEEFDRDGWGTIEPYYFKDPPKSEDHPDYDSEEDNCEMSGLYDVLERSAKRINNLK
jgi:hypothetical protein